MILLTQFTFNLAASWWYLLLLGLILVAAAVYTYRYTVPPVGRGIKIILIFLRSLAIISVAFLLFEPVVGITTTDEIKPVHMIFIDNSSSIVQKDSVDKMNIINNFYEELSASVSSYKTFSFGSKVNNVSPDSTAFLNFNESITNFSDITSYLKKSETNIASAVILSDGVMTAGSNPVYSAAKMNIPFFTIGLGDSSAINDIIIGSVIYNDIIYAQSSTNISVTLNSHGITADKLPVRLYEENNLIYEGRINLKKSSSANIILPYEPETGGEKKLTVYVPPVKGEYNQENNRKIFFVNVLSNKLRVLILAGVPSTDVSFIKSAAAKDTNITVNSVVSTRDGSYLDDPFRPQLVDSADVIFLTEFPSSFTASKDLNKVIEAVTKNNKPFFIQITDQTDVNGLNRFAEALPFRFNGMNQRILQVQPYIPQSESRNPLLLNSAPDIISAWNNLPPVPHVDWNIEARPEARTIAFSTANSIRLEAPLIVTRNFGAERSIAVMAGELWKWKLKTASDNSDLYDRFILNSIKWLHSAGERKQVRIRTTKKLYSNNEPVEFTAEVYNESFDPVSDAEVKIAIRHEDKQSQIILNPLGSGLYSGRFETIMTGDFRYTGTAVSNGIISGRDYGRFSIGEVNPELLDTRLNTSLMRLLANETGGRFYYNSQFAELFKRLESLEKAAVKQKTETSEIVLWSNEWFMAVIILALALEWFIRKREGML